MEYIGEHLLPGQIGEFFIALAFSAAIFSMVSYYFSAKEESADSWKKLGRIGFIIHGLSVFMVIGTLFYLFMNHHYEYNYVYKYSSKTMPMKYVFSAFWSGQEGSFLLWSFWHIVLGGLLILKGKKWEKHTMTILAMVQVFISSMLLGVYFMDYKFGSNPFILNRELPETILMPWASSESYLSLLFADGRGLNPLLQNYWMTIHPPTLFLGFASTVVPFAFAIAGLWKRDYSGWIKPALPWTFFSVMILGTGILMGGAWAYESLTFGGFWAWDPVENASLVPWIILVAGAHIMLINKHKPKSLFSAFLFIILSFIFILYSTFLTRSGILGESSVHSFVESGILPQLLIYLLFFVGMAVAMLHKDVRERKIYSWASFLIFVLGIGLYLLDTVAVRFEYAPAAFVVLFLLLSAVYTVKAYIKHYRTDEDEPLVSREFWMFIGGLVLFISALQITIWTSIPVFNHVASPFQSIYANIANLTGWEWAASLAEGKLSIGSDVVNIYNRWQIPFTVLITLFIGTTQFMKYGKNDAGKWIKAVSLSLIISAAITSFFLFVWGFEDNTYPSNYVLLFTSTFAVVANADYLIRVLKGNIRKGGSPIAHVGFGLLIFGALVSQSQQDIISTTKTTDITGLGGGINSKEDQLMYKGDTLTMGNYMTTYTGYDSDGRNAYYHIDYYSQVANSFQKDDIAYRLIQNLPVFFIAKQDHTTAPTFIEDMETHWYPLPAPTETQLDRAKKWRGFNPGKKEFTLSPRIQINETFGNAPEPDTKHYGNEDLFTFLKFAQIEKLKTDSLGFLPMKETKMILGDTLKLTEGLLIVDSLRPMGEEKAIFGFLSSDIVLKTYMHFTSEEKDTLLTSRFLVRGNQAVGEEITLEKEGFKATIKLIQPKHSSAEITLEHAEKSQNYRDFIVMRAVKFPQINILWIGCLIMILGTIIAIIERIRTNRIGRKTA